RRGRSSTDQAGKPRAGMVGKLSRKTAERERTFRDGRHRMHDRVARLCMQRNWGVDRESIRNTKSRDGNDGSGKKRNAECGRDHSIAAEHEGAARTASG